jgi:hypothetical protein
VNKVSRIGRFGPCNPVLRARLLGRNRITPAQTAAGEVVKAIDGGPSNHRHRELALFGKMPAGGHGRLGPLERGRRDSKRGWPRDVRPTGLAPELDKIAICWLYFINEHP